MAGSRSGVGGSPKSVAEAGAGLAPKSFILCSWVVAASRELAQCTRSWLSCSLCKTSGLWLRVPVCMSGFFLCRTVGPSCVCSWARSLPLPLSAGQLTSGRACSWAWPLLQNAGPWTPQGRPRVWTSGVGSQSAACHPPGRFRAYAWARPFKLHCFLDFGGVVTLSFF